MKKGPAHSLNGTERPFHPSGGTMLSHTVRRVVATMVFGLLAVSFGAAQASTSRGGLPHKLEFFDGDVCGDKGYVLSAEHLGPFSMLVTLGVCRIRFKQVPGEPYIVPSVKGAGFHARPGVPNTPVVVNPVVQI